jgi:hypothetical protein
VTNIFDNDDLRVQLADRMKMDVGDVEDFWPLDDPTDDYSVLLWMRHEVQHKYPSTYIQFISYVSGAMHSYNVGDYTRNAMLAVGIIDNSKDK